MVVCGLILPLLVVVNLYVCKLFIHSICDEDSSTLL